MELPPNRTMYFCPFLDLFWYVDFAYMRLISVLIFCVLMRGKSDAIRELFALRRFRANCLTRKVGVWQWLFLSCVAYTSIDTDIVCKVHVIREVWSLDSSIPLLYKIKIAYDLYNVRHQPNECEGHNTL